MWKAVNKREVGAEKHTGANLRIGIKFFGDVLSKSRSGEIIGIERDEDIGTFEDSAAGGKVFGVRDVESLHIANRIKSQATAVDIGTVILRYVKIRAVVSVT
jgi:hypothetical protein